MTQYMHRSETLAPGLPGFPFPSLIPWHCATDNHKVVTVTVTDIFSTHYTVIM